MSINISEMIWTVICFFALLLVLKTFLFGPIMHHMDERRSRIDAGLEAQRRAQEAKDAARREAEENWQRSSDEARAALAQGRSQAEKRRVDELEAARQRSEQLVSDGRADAEREEETARETVERRGDELARALADRLLSGGEER